MDLKELMGDAYKEDITKEEVQKFFKNQVLASGDYENKEKASAEKRNLENQVAELQKQLEGKMTDDEKKKAADEDTKKLIEKLQQQLAESNITIAKKTALSSLSGIKSKAGIKDNDKDFDEFISSIAFEDNSKTDKISQYISKIVTSAYETGKSEVIKDKLGKMGSFKEGQDGNATPEKGAYGKELAQATKVDNKVQKDFFKKD